MWFKKKRDVDLRELQKKGILLNPHEEKELETDKDGFVEVGSSQNTPTTKDNLGSSESSPGFFNFFEANSSSTTASGSVSDSNIYTKREIDSKKEEVENKLYKLEQRIELLERKMGVGSSSGYSW